MRFNSAIAGPVVRALFFYGCVQLGLGFSAEDLASDNGSTWIFALAFTIFGVAVSAALAWAKQRRESKQSAAQPTQAA